MLTEMSHDSFGLRTHLIRSRSTTPNTVPTITAVAQVAQRSGGATENENSTKTNSCTEMSTKINYVQLQIVKVKLINKKGKRLSCSFKEKLHDEE